ncbi:porin family protein [Mariniphaga sediminis]|uniref:Porin family protein n=1 Tax=Mariniphaga sediminis TaxID=1628158 RepID=A0A399CUD2_9BACT|nr:outer membrane beta-barrel protein [Mariniphaga sediminis]RIH62758.1 porin family protein [Mariniphaga sediminis]
MNKQLLVFLITLLSYNGYSQISFEKGYYVNNDDQKIDCIIKNIDWEDNPTQFVYKLSEYDEQKTLTIDSVKEFGINNISKYIRHKVKIDRSSNDINDLSNDRNPAFMEETHFLKVLIEGKINLYSYKEGNPIRYFFNKGNSGIEQLVYKEYTTSENKVGVNAQFKQQLWLLLRCPCISVSDIEQINYRRKELVSLFKTFHECSHSECISFEKRQNKNSFNISIRPGLNRSSLSISNSNNTDFGAELGFRFGVEAEYVLPFNKNKWGVLIEPTYQYFKSEKIVSYRNVSVDYKSIELPIGIRHYFFLNDNSKVFVNGSFILEYSGKSKIDYVNSIILEIKTGINFAFGLGYKYNNRYSVELRYLTDKDFFRNYMYLKNDYKTLSVVFGYTLFKNTQ